MLLLLLWRHASHYVDHPAASQSQLRSSLAQSMRFLSIPPADEMRMDVYAKLAPALQRLEGLDTVRFLVISGCTSSCLLPPRRACFDLCGASSLCVMHRALVVPRNRWPPLQNHLLTPITVLPSRMAVQSDVYWNHAREVARFDGGWCARGGVGGAHIVYCLFALDICCSFVQHMDVSLLVSRENLSDPS